jgi:toxin HigB-1
MCYNEKDKMIKSFRDKETERIYQGYRSFKLDQSMQSVAYRKLHMLDNAYQLQDLTAPPSNHLEKLKGNLEGRYSIRINDQYRICFIWQNNDCFEVEIIDYH